MVFGHGWSVSWSLSVIHQHQSSSVIHHPSWWPSVIVSRGWLSSVDIGGGQSGSGWLSPVISHRHHHQSLPSSSVVVGHHGLWVSHQSSVVVSSWLWSVVTSRVSCAVVAVCWSSLVIVSHQSWSSVVVGHHQSLTVCHHLSIISQSSSVIIGSRQSWPVIGQSLMSVVSHGLRSWSVGRSVVVRRHQSSSVVCRAQVERGIGKLKAWAGENYMAFNNLENW